MRFNDVVPPNGAVLSPVILCDRPLNKTKVDLPLPC